MSEEEYNIGDRVHYFRLETTLNAIVIDIREGMYLLRFDDTDYGDTWADGDYMTHINE